MKFTIFKKLGVSILKNQKKKKRNISTDSNYKDLELLINHVQF